jgi:hypothetical protein
MLQCVFNPAHALLRIAGQVDSMVPKWNITTPAPTSPGTRAAGEQLMSTADTGDTAQAEAKRDGTRQFRSSLGRSLNRLLSDSRDDDADKESSSLLGAASATSMALGILSSLAAPDKQRKKRAAPR